MNWSDASEITGSLTDSSTNNKEQLQIENCLWGQWYSVEILKDPGQPKKLNLQLQLKVQLHKLLEAKEKENTDC